jgi:putative hemolysin
MGSSPEDIIFELLLILLLTLLNAFLSASEIAVISFNKNRLHSLQEEGNKKAFIIEQLIDEPSKFLSTIQAVIAISGLLASATAATSITKNFSYLLNSINLPASKQISVVLITVILAFFILVFGELFPKRFALQSSENFALFVARPLLLILKFMHPFVKLLTYATNILLKIFNINPERLEEKVSEEELRSMIEVGEENGIINEIEKGMIDSIFEFDDTLAKEIMTPRTHVFDLNINLPTSEIIDRIIEEQYSRIPIYDNDNDNIIGVLYMKDLFEPIKNGNLETLNIKELLRPAYFVPETKKIDTLFKELQNTNNHMAILIDEYGGFSGIVTIEDLIEEIMGNIADEHDEYDVNDDCIIKIDSNTYMVSGMTPIDDINDAFNLDISSADYDTIGGFVLTLLGSIPNEDEEYTLEYKELTIKITKISEKRIEELKIYIQPKESSN